MSLTYTLEQVEQVLARFAPDLLGAEFRARSHDCWPCKRGARGGVLDEAAGELCFSGSLREMRGVAQLGPLSAGGEAPAGGPAACGFSDCGRYKLAGWSMRQRQRLSDDVICTLWAHVGRWRPVMP